MGAKKRFVAIAVVVVLASCHEDPNTGLPAAGVRLPWRSYPDCLHRIDLFGQNASIPRHRVLASVFVSCPQWLPDECDSALKARACELGGDAVIISGSDESSAPVGSSPRRNPRRGRNGVVISWHDTMPDASAPAAYAGAVDAGSDGEASF